MIRFTQGNLLETDAEAMVNTVNTVGIMGKGIALMFKEKFPRNFETYARACEAGEIRVGRMFVTETKELFGPRWIINFPTKEHWRGKTNIDWVEEGLKDLARVIREKAIRSIAVPPLGCGNGGLDWREVKPLIEQALGGIDGVEVVVFEPTEKYQNVAKRTGVEKLTPARALVAEIVRRYCLLGIDCSILEIQKLGWFLERGVLRLRLDDPLKFKFQANKYGPYSHNLTKLLDTLDGSYLRCDKRLSDARPRDLIWFNEDKRDYVAAYLNSSEAKPYGPALEWAAETVDGFQSPLSMELLATVDWMVERDRTEPTVDAVFSRLGNWAGGEASGKRKLKIFDKRQVGIALGQLHAANQKLAA
jgi:O-acetyl-ADP-ribose deacetylase (regulator of RNase III)